jgi:pyruvate-formate lyase-activating enzyme
MSKKLSLVYCGTDGNIYDEESIPASFRTGRTIVEADIRECIKLPFGSEIFSLPGRYPVSLKNGKASQVKKLYDMNVIAASAFLPSGYLRTYLPAYVEGKEKQRLSLWAYAGIGISGDDFYAPGFRVDDDIRSDPEIHCNDDELAEKVKEVTALFPENRLVKQLSYCAQEYRCLCARNFFLGRHEAPVPTSPTCNSGCLGCLSYQDEKHSGFGSSQYRLTFAPTPEEISQVILRHFRNVPDGVASFGQGCEGEPLLRGDDLVEAVRLVRAETSTGTVHCNTNGSRPDVLAKMFDAGLDSVRVSMNSTSEKYYNPYYQPRGYTHSDILSSVKLALDRGKFVSINLFFLPGFTDSAEEVDSLVSFLSRYPVNMIQTRNLNIDPDFYLDTIQFTESRPFGIRALVERLRAEYPLMKIGYYNPRVKK